MADPARLTEFTDSYLKSLVCAVCGSLGSDFDGATPFGELGVDSFRVLKIIKALEADFGALPKTLLFENFNINDLSRYFIENHAHTLSAKLAKATNGQAKSAAAAQPVKWTPKPKPVAKRAQPLLMAEKDAFANPHIRSLFDLHKNEGSVSRGTRNIAPNVFIGSERKGYFNYSRSKNLLLAYTYTGPKEYFPTVAKELFQYCEEQRLELNMLAEDELTSFAGVPVSSTPFGALQRVRDLKSFSLEGAAMRRLRYQVSKFSKSGVCRTEEYRQGVNPDLALNIASIIDQWCASRSMVNPLIHIVKDEILAGTLNAEHRIFLTYVDDVLHNVILISPMSAEQNGYLMDLEFYTESMPLGGLEYAIVKIIETLVAEGCDLLSLGGTYGCKLQESANADPAVDKILDDLRMQNIFNDEGNLQFKNKFRPENKTIFLCRPVGRCTPDNVIDIIMMIADPAKNQMPETEAAAPTTESLIIEGEKRSAVLADFAFNPMNVPPEQVDIDLKTDSWAQLKMPVIDNHTQRLHAQLQQPADLNRALAEIFPFTHFSLTRSGRTAESVFYKAWPQKGVVLSNLLFPTTIFHQIDKGFAPKELPHAAVFDLESSEPFKGDLDFEAVAQEPKPALICVELSNNASGGQPVTIENLQRLKTLSVPIVMDGTRALENAQFLIENGLTGKTVWEVARELFSYADAVVVSLAKDFCVKGGLIATNDAALHRTIQALILEEGCGLDAIDKKLAALTLRDRHSLESLTLCRKETVKRIGAALQERGVPVVQPIGGHCVLLDVKQVAEIRDFQEPVASFVAWMYLNTGIRAGAHSAGMQKDTALNGLVRLAIPLGLKREEADSIIERLTTLFAEKKNIPELVKVEKGKYRLKQYHHLAGALVSRDALQPKARREISSQDIAVVGMAGRYPKARNLHQMWDNLIQAKDCIEEIPDARLEQRLHNRFTRKYRGGFIDGVDQFDARFFNISPKEAEMLDPQERLFLEVACEAIEDAGYYPETLDPARDIGVFVGAVWSMYQMLGAEEKIAGHNLNPSSFFWSIANRVSYWMNLSGPSLTLDTACSASLTAIQLACEAIHRGECSGAIVGGINLDLHQAKFDINSVGGSLSPDGVCRSFGKGANGYVSGEGVGALFLKPLARAVADGDNIHGVIKSAVVMHSGRTSGYMIPGPNQQTKLVLKALERADIDARSIGYIEAHGTGTDLGDSIEITGLTHAFQKYGVESQSCSIGSVKTNIGHLEAASGIVGVQKILLQMKHRKLVPSLHSTELNDGIDFASSPFHVQQKVEEWKAKEVEGVIVPRRAGISALGAGGTNAHLILEEYVPESLGADTQPQDKIFPLSARSEEQLKQTAARLRDFLKAGPDVDANDIAHTLQVGRKAYDCRLTIVAKTSQELTEKLTAFLAGQKVDDVIHGHVKNAEAITGFLNGKEKQDFVQLLVQGRDPRRLAKLWSDGVIADWRGLDIGQAGRKTSLPTYPFATERYWITQRKAAPAQPVIAVDVKPALTISGRRTPVSVEDKARLFVRQMLASQLKISPEQVEDSNHLMDTGITSLDMAEMTQSIKDRLDASFSPIAFFECTTVGSFSDLLATRYAPAFQKMTEVRFDGLKKPLHVQDAESELVIANLAEVPEAEKQKMRCVLLTGATGFLGSHLLSELLSSDPEASVYCLVRASSREQGLQRILKQAAKFELSVDEARIHVVCGDINKPRLGMSEEDWDHCCRKTQQILHASAHVNHIEGYATFRDSTHGMKEVIRLASTHKLKFVQFISSIACCALKIGEEFSMFDKEDFVAEGEHVYGGYGQSKWVQETFLKRAHLQGVPYVIYRFGELSGSSRTGLGQTDDMLHRLLQMRLAVGCKEKISNDVLDMLPVDFAAKLIVDSGKHPELWNRIVHATHLQPYGFASLYRKAQHLGLQFKPATRTEYLAKCYEYVRYIYSINPINGFVLECVLRDAEGSIRNRKMMDGYFSVIFPFEQDHFTRALKTLGLTMPDWSSLLDRYFGRWSREDCGFMARIHDFQKWVELDEAQKLAVLSEKVAALKSPKLKAPGKKSVHELAMLGNGSEG